MLGKGLEVLQEVSSHSDHALLSVRKVDVPLYLQAGDFYKSLNDDDQSEAIQVPADVLKETTGIESIEDLVHLISSLRYWMVTSPLTEIVEFVLSQETDQEVVDVISPFTANFTYLSHLHLIRSQYGIKEPYLFIEDALRLGSVEIVRYLHQERNVTLSEKLCTIAATHGHLSCLQYLHEQGLKNTAPPLNAAIQHGHLECVRYLHSLGTIKNNMTTATKAACMYNQLEILTFLHEQGYAWHRLCTHSAATAGHLECLKYAHEHSSTPLASSTFTATAANGHMHVLQYLHEQRCPYDDDIMQQVATVGRLDCVVFLHTMGIPWNAETFAVAIANGHLHIVQHLYEHGCPREHDCIEYAIMYNHIPLVAFLREIGCSWSDKSTGVAIYNNNLTMLQYLHTQGCPWSVSCYRLAEEKNNKEILDYLKNNSFEAVISFEEYLKTK